MKYFNVAFLCVVFLASCDNSQQDTKHDSSACTNSDEMLTEKSDADRFFVSTDFSKYLGGPVKNLVHDFSVNYEDRIGNQEPPGKLIGVHYTFPGNYSIDVYPPKFRYTKRFSTKSDWDFDIFENETVSGIQVTHYGSNDYYCKDFGKVWPECGC